MKLAVCMDMVGIHWKLTFTDPSAAALSVRLIRLLVLDELRLDFFSFKVECCRSSTVGQMQIGGNT